MGNVTDGRSILNPYSIFSALACITVCFMCRITQLWLNDGFPLLSAYVPNFASSTKLASYYGLQACIGGIFAFIGNSLAGWLLGLNFQPTGSG